MLTTEWHKSTRSDNSGPYCVEARLDDYGVLVRDSNNRAAPILRFTPAEWQAFLDGVKAGEFDLP